MMKSKTMKIAAVALVLAVAISCVLSISAKSYVVNVLSDDFSDAGKSEFLPAGDLNADKKIDSTDITSLKKIILKNNTDSTYTAVYGEYGDEALYADVTGDGMVNIIDLVRQKKLSAGSYEVVENGALVLKGNTAYKNDLLSVMGTGAKYRVQFTYKSSDSVTLKLNSMGEEIKIEKDAADRETTVSEIITAPLSFADDGIDLQIICKDGIIKDFSITRIDMDNEISADGIK